MLELELNPNPVEKLRNRFLDLLPIVTKDTIFIDGHRIERKIVIDEGGTTVAGLISDAVAGSIADIFIFSPMFSGGICEFAEAFSEKFFIATADIENCMLENISRFAFDYSDAYYQAGEWAALQKIDIYALFYNGGRRYREAEHSFSDGWSAKKTLNELVITRFENIDDVDAGFIDSFTAPFINEKVVAAVFAGPHNGTILNRFDGTPVLILSEFMIPWTPAIYNMAGSIELGTVKILSEIIKSVNIETYKNGGSIKADFFSNESHE